MSSDSESDSKRPNGVSIDGTETPIEPSTPQEVGHYELSQVTLPSTEVPASPVNDANDSFRTEVNDDRAAVTIIRSSLTPPPSTQVGPSGSHVNGNSRRTRQPIVQSQESNQSNLVSPPATILTTVLARDITDFVPPSPRQVRESSADELRAMLQTCIADHQKLKMETAHHRLQYSLLSLQASEDANRAHVELDMLRKEIDALRTAEHSRQAKRELSAFSEAVQTKFFELKAAHEEALLEIEALERRLKNAKRIIGQKDEEVMSLIEERHQLLNRIRENREHMNKLRSPGGIFHGATTPRQNPSSPAQSRNAHRSGQRGLDRDDSGSNKLSTLLEVISQDNNSAPSTPMLSNRSHNPRHGGKHQRNAQSMSSLPTTPMHRPRGPYAGLLPSANLVPQTEPYNHRYAPRLYDPGSPTPRTERRKSRESTISAEDNEELARQALKSFASGGVLGGSQLSRGEEGSDAYGSQASQAATEMLRRDPRESFEMRQALSRDGTPSAVEQSARLQSKLFSNVRNDGDKRKYGSSQETIDEPRLEQGSPPKRSRVDSGSAVQSRMGLGIQYGR